jgi:hypothetical protein
LRDGDRFRYEWVDRSTRRRGDVKELLSVRMNRQAVSVPKDDEKGGEDLIPYPEIILILSEPQYRLGGGNEIIRERTASEVRFAASPVNLRAFAQLLVSFADDADQWWESVDKEAYPYTDQEEAKQ